MKKYLFPSLALLLTLALTGCGCKHETWNEATCQVPKTCAECGVTEGEITDHRWADATCQAPKTCEFCGETEGEITDHKWVDATCQAPKTCEFCGETEGKVTNHKWADATCEAPKTCRYCGKEGNGKPLGHTWRGTNRTCSTCGKTEESCEHDWVEATCTTPKYCKVCGFEERIYLAHDYQDATCTAPQICRTCGDEAYEALGHNWYELNGDASLCCHRCSTSINYIGLFKMRANVDNGWHDFAIFSDAELEYAYATRVSDGATAKVYDCGESDADIYYAFYDDVSGYGRINNLIPEHALDYQQGGSSSSGGGSSSSGGGNSSGNASNASLEAAVQALNATYRAEGITNVTFEVRTSSEGVAFVYIEWDDNSAYSNLQTDMEIVSTYNILMHDPTHGKDNDFAKLIKEAEKNRLEWQGIYNDFCLDVTTELIVNQGFSCPVMLGVVDKSSGFKGPIYISSMGQKDYDVLDNYMQENGYVWYQ